jgi:hypothetical protein
MRPTNFALPILRLMSIFVGGISCVATFAPARGDINLPKVDLQQRCEDSRRAMETLLGTKTSERTFDSCISDERNARDVLVRDWATIPPSVKAQCVTAGYSPSYIEWQICTEVAGDVLKMRNELPLNVRFIRHCPIVHYNTDGSATRINACPLARTNGK